MTRTRLDVSCGRAVGNYGFKRFLQEAVESAGSSYPKTSLAILVTSELSAGTSWDVPASELAVAGVVVGGMRIGEDGLAAEWFGSFDGLEKSSRLAGVP